MALVYLATNRINGKRYIGVTVKSLDRRKAQHFRDAKKMKFKMAFHRAIRKHGEGAFEWAVLAEYETRDEAFAQEIRFIAALKPEYNMTRGGEGVVDPTGEIGRRISRAKMGFRHRPDTIERLRETGRAGKERFARYAAMGPMASAKPVICLDDGLEFGSASAAARHYGIDKNSINQLCANRPNRVTAGGRRFAYAAGTTALRESKKHKLLKAQVSDIKAALRYGASFRQIAWAYDVSPATIGDISQGRTWRKTDAASA